MKTKSLLLATALLMSTSAFAQKNTFKGVVLDDLGEPVIGATIQVKGVKGAGAITDLDGNFVIDADANQTLLITYIGYKDAEIRPSANMKITLKQDFGRSGCCRLRCSEEERGNSCHRQSEHRRFGWQEPSAC